jgi:hypothetical protein
MNIVLAVTILISLSCVAFSRIVILYNIKYKKDILSNEANAALVVAFISTFVFILEFLFSPFSIIL